LHVTLTRLSVEGLFRGVREMVAPRLKCDERGLGESDEEFRD